jgi:hypothetical protein
MVFLQGAARESGPVAACIRLAELGRGPQGRRPFFHLLNECRLPGHKQDFALIDFHVLFALTVPLAREFANQAGDRLRLLPPYRDHLSQAFARLFMRVGLPADIPPFGKKK